MRYDLVRMMLCELDFEPGTTNPDSVLKQHYREVYLTKSVGLCIHGLTI
jgi:hypothetical protein